MRLSVVVTCTQPWPEVRGCLERIAPLTGIVFAVIFYVAVALSGSEPDADAGVAKAVRYWTNHDGKRCSAPARPPRHR